MVGWLPIAKPTLQTDIANLALRAVSSGNIQPVTLLEMTKVVECADMYWLDMRGVIKYLPDPVERLRYYELLGGRPIGMYWRHGAPDIERQIVAAEFLRDPSRTALLPVIRYLCSDFESPSPTPIPLATIRAIEPEFVHQREALAVIAAGQPELDHNTAEWLTSVLCENTDLAFEALTNSSANVKSERVLAQLAKGLLDRLPLEDWYGRQAAYGLLDDILRRSKSDLGSLPSTVSEKWFRDTARG